MRKVLFLLTVLLLCFLCACSDNPPKRATDGGSSTGAPSEGTYQKISGKAAKTMMDDGNPFILLDVRTDEEFKEKRIDGAILIPDYEISSRAETELADKNARIFIYCRSGRRSANVAHEMISMGYTNIYDFGGIIDWPYDTVSG